MKRIFFFLAILNLLTFLFLYSKQNPNNRDERIQARQSFSRYMEYAHPTPVGIQEVLPMIPFIENSSPALFLNVNTVEQESDQLPVQNESSIAINPMNPINLVASAVDYRDSSSTWVYVSSDGGKTWENKNLKKPFPKWRASNDPSVAFDNDGSAYLVYGGFGNLADSNSVMHGENGVFFARSSDEGKTWEPHIPVILHRGEQTLDSTFEDKYYISVDNSPSSPYKHNLYIPWKRVTPRDSATQIVIAKSTDKGTTWSKPVPVSKRLSGSSEDTTYGQSFPLAITGPNGEVYVIWNNGIAHGVGFSKSVDGGITFTEPKIIEHYNIFGETKLLTGQGYRHSVKGVVRAETYPSMVCDITGGIRNGTLYLCWAGDRKPNIYFSRSSDGGDTWYKPVIVHSDTTNDQFWQWIAIDPKNGDLAIMYLDSRNDPQNIMTECYVSYSSDGGLTWIDRPVSDTRFDPRRNPFPGNSFLGDYNGCIFYNGVIYPSWVDTRNATTGFDDDVYTAIVNTRQPESPKNFKAKVIPENPTVLNLSWEEPTKRIFGKPLLSSEFKYALYRNNIFIKELSSAEKNFSDSNLTAYNKNYYSIYTVAGNDSSNKTVASAFAGGAKQPSSPNILSSSGNSINEVILNISMPTLRIDSITPLSNLNQIEIYRDGNLIKTFGLLKSDTGKTLQFRDTVKIRGFYSYQAKIIDKADNPEVPAQASDLSNESIVYTGIVEETISESFDNAPLPKYLIRGGWATTNKFYKNSPNSLTESHDGKYKGNARDTFLLFPVKVPKEPLYLNIWQAVIVDKSDSAIIEISYDNMNNWEFYANYNKEFYQPWQDSILNSSDWIPETFNLFGNPGDTLFVRFRFWSSLLKNDDGWYIDDITINSTTSVSENNNPNSFELYPNPATNVITILNYGNLISDINKIYLYSVYGERINIENKLLQKNINSITFDISDLPQGIYYLRTLGNANKLQECKFIIIR